VKPGALLLVGLLPPAAAVAAASCAVFGDFSLSTGPCAAGEVCFAAPPAFSGPVLALDGPAGCPEGWAVLPLEVEHLVGPIDPQCLCDCVQPPPDCSSSSLVLFSDTACTQPGIKLAPAMCTATGAIDAAAAKVMLVVKPPAPTCGASDVKMLRARLTTEHVTLCTPSSAGASCGQGSMCTPSVPPSSAACVYTSGDLPCPVGFARRTALASGFTDESACDGSGCQCTELQAASCTGSAIISTGTACNTSPLMVGTSCLKLSSLIESYSFPVAANAPVCVAKGTAVAKPNVVPTDPNSVYTLCCP
jgi:hypothetical protein